MSAPEDDPTRPQMPPQPGKRASADPDATRPVNPNGFYEDEDDDDDGDEMTHAIVAGVVKSRGKGQGPARIQIEAGSGRNGPRITFPADPTSQPVCAVLLITKGAGQGICIPISQGRSAVGRGKDAKVQLDLGDKALSAMQFIIIYDEEDGSFDLKEADAASSSTTVDGAKVKTSVALKAGSIIKAGMTEFRFIPCVGPDWSWASVLAGD